MRIHEHLAKARRFRLAMRSLRAEAHYEMYFELAMHVGTQLFNALLHATDITDHTQDHIHSDMPPLAGPLPSSVLQARKALARIEFGRALYVRGSLRWDSRAASRLLRALRQIEEHTRIVIEGPNTDESADAR